MKTYYLLLIFVMLTLQSCGVKQPVQMSGILFLKDGMPIPKVLS